MLDEQSVPVSERCLLVQGIVAPSTYSLVKDGLPSHWPQTAVCCFVSYAYADLPIGKTFDRVFSRANYRSAQAARCTIIAVTQQFGRVFDQVPHGWKTICLLDFSDGVPDLIRTLPVIESWGDAELRLGVVLTSEETWTGVIGLGPR